MLVHPRGLITGGDATTQGGQNVGRVAFYDFTSTPASGANETTITNPIEGRVEEADGEFVIDGTATRHQRRPAGRSSSCRTATPTSTSRTTWSPGARPTRSTSTSPTPDATTTNWSLPLTISDNRVLQVWARTYAINGTNDATKAIKKFETFSLADETPTRVDHRPVRHHPVDDVHRHRHGDRRHRRPLDQLRHQERPRTGTCRTTAPRRRTYNSFTHPARRGRRGQHHLVRPRSPCPTRASGGCGHPAGHRRPVLARRVRAATGSSATTAIAPTVTITAPALMMPPTDDRPGHRRAGQPDDLLGHRDRRREPRLNVEIQLRNTTTRETLAADGTWGVDLVGRLVPRHRRSNLNGDSYNWSYTTPFNLTPGSVLVLGPGDRRPRPHDVVDQPGPADDQRPDPGRRPARTRCSTSPAPRPAARSLQPRT